MKVSVVFTGLPGEEYHPDSGGIELAEYSFCERASSSDRKITAIVGDSGNKALRLLNTKAEVIRIPTGEFVKGGLVDSWPFCCRSSAILLEKYLKGSVDIVHFTSLFPAMSLICNRSYEYFRQNNRFTGKCVYTIHNYHYSVADGPEDIFAKYPVEWLFLHESEREVVGRADNIIVTCANYRSILGKKFGRNIDYLPNTIGELSDYPVRFEVNNTYKIFLTMSRLSPEKNISKTLEAFKLLLHHDQSCKYIIAGEGEIKEELVAKAISLGFRVKIFEEGDSVRTFIRSGDLKNFEVVFTGKVITEEKHNLLNVADVFITLSKHEISPLVGLECLVFGRHMIVGDSYGWRDYLERGASMFLVEKEDVESILDSMIRSVLLVSGDREGIAIKNQEAYSRYYSAKKVVQSRMKYYEEV